MTLRRKPDCCPSIPQHAGTICPKNYIPLVPWCFAKSSGDLEGMGTNLLWHSSKPPCLLLPISSDTNGAFVLKGVRGIPAPNMSCLQLPYFSDLGPAMGSGPPNMFCVGIFSLLTAVSGDPTSVGHTPASSFLPLCQLSYPQIHSL